MSEKKKGLLANVCLYVLALGIGMIPYFLVEEMILATGLMTVTATLAIYLVTCFIPDTSLYDPYWSVAPPVLLLLNMIRYGLWNGVSWLFFLTVLVWSVRLTGNWVLTYKGLRHEDWRYAMYRAKCSPFGFAVINLVGLQMVPTVVVFAGLVGPLLAMQEGTFSPWIFAGLFLSLTGVALELVADTVVHAFLKEGKAAGRTCQRSIWKYSRHPNYLGELSFWSGLFFATVAVIPGRWYLGAGVLLVWILFCTVSIPMMEKHNLERRTDYAQYKEQTSPLFLFLPKAKR